MEKNIYKAASKANLLFAIGESGQKLAVNQLWSLPMKTNDPKGLSLNALAIELKKQIEETPVTDFVGEFTGVDPLVQLRFNIVLDVIETRKAEAAANVVAAEMQSISKRAKAELAKRQEKKFESMTDEQLQALAGQ